MKKRNTFEFQHSPANLIGATLAWTKIKHLQHRCCRRSLSHKPTNKK